MRNKYSKEFEEELRKIKDTHNLQDMIKFAKEKFGYDIPKRCMQKYLYRHNIRHKDYVPQKGHANNVKPIGSETVKDDGMVLVKIGNPSKWVYKQRYIYEKHFGEIPKGYMVVFLDGDRNNYDINNLMAVSTKMYNYAKNKGLISSDKELTRTALFLATLDEKTKEIENENTK